MHTKSIDVKIIESTPDLVKVKLPFMEIPMDISRDYFIKWLESGEFRLVDISQNKLANKDSAFKKINHL